MDRFSFVPTTSSETSPHHCWNCGRVSDGAPQATYLYRRTNQAILEEWRRCECGAFQNTARPHEIEIERSAIRRY